jgi:isocitrate lyase
MKHDGQIDKLAASWMSEARWQGIERPYEAEQVVRLRGSVRIEHTLARMGAERLWRLLHVEDYVAALGALTGNQAVQQEHQRVGRAIIQAVPDHRPAAARSE